MDDLRERFTTLDRLPVPDLWGDVERRLEVLDTTVPTGRLTVVETEWRGTARGGSFGPRGRASSQRRLFLAAAIIAVLIGSAIAVGSGVVNSPAVVVPSPSPQVSLVETASPSPRETTPSPAPSGLLGGGVILAHSWTKTYDHGPYDVFAIDPGTREHTLLGTLPGQVNPYRFQRSTDGSHVLILNWNMDEASSLTSPTAASRALGFIDAAQLNLDCCKGGSAETMVLSPRGDRIATVHHDGFDVAIEIVILDVTGGGSQRLPLPKGMTRLGVQSWAPDGSALLAAGCRPCNKAQTPTERQTADHSHLYIVPLDGSPWRELLDVDNGWVTADWSPDGGTLATGTSVCPSGSHMPRCDPAASKVSLGTVAVADGASSTYAQRSGYFDVKWSPDGRRIAYRTKDGIYVVAADGSDEVRLAQPGGDETGVDWSPDGQWLLFPQDPSELWIVPAAGGEARRIGTEYAGAAWR